MSHLEIAFKVNKNFRTYFQFHISAMRSKKPVFPPTLGNLWDTFLISPEYFKNNSVALGHTMQTERT